MSSVPQYHPEEVKRLQRCINDLVTLLALPAIWTDQSPKRIVSTLVDSLAGMLALDFCAARLHPDICHDQWIAARASSNQVFDVGSIALRDDPFEPLSNGSTVCISLQGMKLQTHSLSIGVEGEMGSIIAGSLRRSFPDEIERLVLNVAANQATINLQQAQRLSEQKNVTRELDYHVAKRTAELAQANEELRKEIAERKRIEDSLRRSEAEIRRSEARLTQVIDTIPALAWCNLPDGPNEFLNKAWHEYTGLSPELSHGWGWQSAMHADDIPALMTKWQVMLTSGEPGEIEARLRRHDGVYRWFLIRAEPLRDESGRILRWYGTSTDIDDLKRAEEELRRSEAFLAEAQYLARTGSFAWKVQSGVIRWSEQLYRIFGFDGSTPVTLERIATRIHPDDVPTFVDMVSRANSGSSNFEFEHRLLMPDQSIRYLHLVAHGYRSSNGEIEYIGAVQDVTDRRSSEEALAEARSELSKATRINSLAMLTASMAHEVNQPLAGIVTNASTCVRMLGAEPPNIEGARETARRTIRDGNRAADVVARLRSLFSKKEVAFEEVDVNEAIREVVALSMSDIQRNRIHLRTSFADSLPRVFGDRIQLQQVIFNLLRNAIDSMNEVRHQARDLVVITKCNLEYEVEVSVSDTGIGIEPQSLDKLFESFYTTKSDGMGIGLSISRSVIEAHHGRIWASLNEGPGATFCFTLPTAA